MHHNLLRANENKPREHLTAFYEVLLQAKSVGIEYKDDGEKGQLFVGSFPERYSRVKDRCEDATDAAKTMEKG